MRSFWHGRRGQIDYMALQFDPQAWLAAAEMEWAKRSDQSENPL